MSRNSRNDSNSPRRVKVVHFPKRKVKASRSSTGLTPIALGVASPHDAEVSEPSGFPVAPAATGAEPTELFETQHDAATEPVMLEQLEAALDAHARVERAAREEARGEQKGRPAFRPSSGSGGAGASRSERSRAESPKRRRSTPTATPTPLDAQLRKVFELLASSEISGEPVPLALVSRLSLLGHRLFEEGRLEAARQIFERLADLTPLDSFPRTMLGTIHLAQHRSKEALEQFEAALRIDGSDLSALVYRGEIRLGAGKVRQGQDDLNRAVELGAADDPFVERARKLLRLAESGKRHRK